MKYELHQGDCREVMATMPDNSVDAIVTDPPYGLSFMGKGWDHGVPGEEFWSEALRVAKPGAHLLAFGGTRTFHRLACAIEDAGWEIRDTVGWIYGCLSEDSEVLTKDGWERYHIARTKEILVYDVQADIYKWEKPGRWNEYRVESDTAYRIQSNQTDQIVSRGHRCIVERGGKLTFVPAEELTGLERVPYLQSDFFALPQERGQLLLKTLLRKGKGLAQTILSKWQREKAARSRAGWREKSSLEGRIDVFQAQGQICQSVDQVCSLSSAISADGSQGRLCNGTQTGGCDADWQATDSTRMCSPHQSRCNRQHLGELDAICDQCGSQKVRTRASYRTDLATVTPIEYSGLIWCPTVSTGAFVARRNGKAFLTGNSGFPKSLDVSKAIDKVAGALGEYGKKKPNVHSRGDHSLHVGWKRPWTEDKRFRLENSFYQFGRRLRLSGRIFLSRFLTVGVTIWKFLRGSSKKKERQWQENPDAVDRSGREYLPATDAARQWSGWGTALKPAWEPVIVARKPLVGTVAANVLEYGTGAINVDGCRVGKNPGYKYRADANGTTFHGEQGNRIKQTASKKGAEFIESTQGRWPANIIHDGSDEVLELFPNNVRMASDPTQIVKTSEFRFMNNNKQGQINVPETKGSAARFFYTAKASKRDRDEGLEGFEERISLRKDLTPEQREYVMAELKRHGVDLQHAQDVA